MKATTSKNTFVTWLQENTVIPAWLPAKLRQAWVVAVLTVIVQAVAISITAGVLQLVPDIGFKGALFILGATFVSHFWGTFPGMVASVVGTFLFDIFLTPPYLTLVPDKTSDMISVLFYLAVCLTISLLVKPADKK